MKWLMLLLVASTLSACAAPEVPTITLNPQPMIQRNDIGHQRVVAVNVVDARQPEYGNIRVNPQQNTTQIFTQALDHALHTYQFQTVNHGAAPAQLTFHILKINYSVAQGYFGSNSETLVSAQVQAKNRHGVYQQTYTASAYNDNYLTYAKQTPSQQVNSAVNQLLTHLFNDQILWHFLAQR